MSTLDRPIWSRYSIALTCPAWSHFQRKKLGKEIWDQGWDKRYRYQEKEKSEETRTGNRKAREKRNQATDFKEAVCCPSVGIQGAAQRKNQGKFPG